MNPDTLNAAMKACGVHHSPAKAAQIAAAYEQLARYKAATERTPNETPNTDAAS